MEEPVIFEILSGLIPLIIVLSAIFFAIKNQKGAFTSKGSLFNQYKFEGDIPTELARIPTAKIGISNYSNMVSIGERDRKLYIKLPFNFIFAVPFTDFSSVRIEDKNNFKVVYVSLKSNPTNLVTFWIPQSEWGKFPELLKMKTASTTIEQSITTKPQKTVNTFIPQSQIQAPLNIDEISNKAGNMIRALILLGVIGFAIFFFITNA